jgi:hypothetical protein
MRVEMPSPIRTVLRVAALASAAVALAAIAPACGPDPVAPEACRQIEEARCRRAPGCGLALSPPEHKTGSDIDACIRFYRDACLHGFAVAADPGDVIVRDCVNAITTGDCKVVKEPGTAPACGFLAPKPAEASDAAAEASDAGGG